MDPQLERQALEAQANAGQAGLKAFSDAQTAIEASKKSAVDAALKEAALRGSPVASQEQIAGTIGGASDRRLADLNQAQATFTADNSRRQQSLTDYFSKVRGGEALIAQEGQQQRDTYAAKLAADISRLQHEGEQSRLTSQMEFENKQKLAELQFAMQQAARAAASKKDKELSADQQLAAIQQAARENLAGKAGQAQAQVNTDYAGVLQNATDINNLAQNQLNDIQNQWTPAAPVSSAPNSTSIMDNRNRLLTQLNDTDWGKLADKQGAESAFNAKNALQAQIDQLSSQLTTANKQKPAAAQPAPKYNLSQWDAPYAALTSKQSALWDTLNKSKSSYESIFTDPTILTNEMLRIGQGAGIDPTVLAQLSPGFKVGQSLGDLLGLESGQGTLAQQQAAADKAQRDAIANTKDQSAAELAAVRDQVANTTGRDLQKIASDAKVTEPAAASVIGSSDFQTAIRSIQGSKVQTKDDLETWLKKNTDSEPVFRALLRSWFADALS